MKRCPQCSRTYTNDNDFCFDDGNALAFISSGASPHAFVTPADTPTQVITRPPSVENRSSGSPLLYVLLGMLATGVLAMGMFIWSTRREPNTNTAAVAPTSPENPVRESSPMSGVSNAVNAVPPTPSVDFQEIREEISARLTRWEHDHETMNVSACTANYAPTVDYYRKRGVSRDFVFTDKTNAFARFTSIDLTITNMDIVPAPDGTSVRALFDKAWIFGGPRPFQGKVRQELKLIRTGSGWLINSERDLKVY